jgi:hypothetical protein
LLRSNPQKHFFSGTHLLEAEYTPRPSAYGKIVKSDKNQ